jgi:hypothetical protein
MDDHDRLLCLETRFEAAERQRIVEVARLARNINALIASLGVLVPSLIVVIIYLVGR